MTDILIDSVTNDAIFINGSTPITDTQNLTVAQKLKIKLQTFKGEWFLDTTVGIPLFQTIFQRGVSKATVDSIFQEAILSEPKVKEIVEFNSIIDPLTRIYQLSFKVRTLDNTTTEYIDILQGV